MPEILEVDSYAQAARTAVGRRIGRITHADPLVASDLGALRAIEGRRLTAVSRHGKVMTLHTSVLAVDLHFGMAGRIVVDGRSPIDELVYAASDDSKWIRFGFTIGRGFIWVSDPRRFARVMPSRRGEGLGPDAMSISRSEFRRAVVDRSAPIKAVLLDQSSIAGLGNMLVDEILWRTGLDPRTRLVDRRTADRLHSRTVAVLADLARRGGSHTGRLSSDLRVPGSACPRDGHVLERATVGGRTTFWCPHHQS